jgi:hypothetical protein
MRLLGNISIGLFFILVAGCNEALKQQQLQGVAKDWCLTIRACEVMPVYPLTEDLQPGDVFLVHQTADQEVATYTQNGFLPLRDIVARLPVTNYPDFYGGRYGIAAGKNPPGIWQFPSPAAMQPDYSNAPHVAFPSFSFSISQGSGASASFPISAIPVGLSLLQTGQANGTVSFGTAYTYGSDIKSVEDLVKAWATTNKDYLQDKVRSLRASTPATQKSKDNGIITLAAKIHDETTPTFLRVVTRVYLIDKVSVALQDTQSVASTFSGGVPKTVDLGSLGSGTADVPKNYDAVNKLLETAASGAPGGTLKLSLAVGRSVSLDSSFTRPLALGYLSIDFEVLDDGSIIAPVSTIKRVGHMLAAVAAK